MIVTERHDAEFGSIAVFGDNALNKFSFFILALAVAVRRIYQQNHFVRIVPNAVTEPDPCEHERARYRHYCAQR